MAILKGPALIPTIVVTNPHISEVYELYYKAFENLRRVKEITSLEDNEKYCEKLKHTLREHLSVIPKLAMGVLETRDLLNQEAMDTFMNTILRSVRKELDLLLVLLIHRRNSPKLSSHRNDRTLTINSRESQDG